MSNPVKELEALLKLHKFEIVRDSNHLVYKNPEGKIFVTSKTPSDYRAARNMLSELRYVLANPKAPIELIEEDRQRKKLESTITLNITVKPLEGMQGAGKKKKSKGTGFIYFDPNEKSLEQIAHEEREAKRIAEMKASGEWQKRQERIAKLEEEKQQRREERRKNEEWARQLSHFRKTSRQYDRDKTDVFDLMTIATLLDHSRVATAGMLRQMRGEGEKVSRENVAMLLDEAFMFTFVKAVTNDGDLEFRKEVKHSAAKWTNSCGTYLIVSSGRMPTHQALTRATLTVTPYHLRILRLSVAWMDRREVKSSTHGVDMPVLPAWLRKEVMGLHTGENATGESFDANLEGAQ